MVAKLVSDFACETERRYQNAQSRVLVYRSDGDILRVILALVWVERIELASDEISKPLRTIIRHFSEQVQDKLEGGPAVDIRLFSPEDAARDLDSWLAGVFCTYPGQRIDVLPHYTDRKPPTQVSAESRDE